MLKIACGRSFMAGSIIIGLTDGQSAFIGAASEAFQRRGRRDKRR